VLLEKFALPLSEELLNLLQLVHAGRPKMFVYKHKQRCAGDDDTQEMCESDDLQKANETARLTT